MEDEKNKPKLTIDDVEMEAMRSSGPGGQNVNKLESGVRFRINVITSVKFSEEEKECLLGALETRLTQDGELIVKATEYRSRRQNEEAALKRLNDIIKEALTPQKERVPTKTPRGAKEKRLGEKRHQKMIINYFLPAN